MEFTSVPHPDRKHKIHFIDIHRFAPRHMPRPDFDIPRFTGDPMALASFFTVFEVFLATAQLSNTHMIAEIFQYLDWTTAD